MTTTKAAHAAGRRKPDADEIFCRQNITPEESGAFWKGWCESQWGMPTFNIMRRCVLARRAAAEASANV